MRIYTEVVILVIAMLLVSTVGISTVFAKIPGNFSTNPNVLKVEINQSGFLGSIMIYHDLKAGYWDVRFAGKQRFLYGSNGNPFQGNISFPDNQVNRFDIP